MKAWRAFLIPAALVCSFAAAADFDLKRLQGDWKITDFQSGAEGGMVRVKDQAITALVRTLDDTPFYRSEGEGKIEPLAGNRILVLGGDPRFGKAEAGFVFKVDEISDGLLLRSGGTAWSFTHVTADEVERRRKEGKVEPRIPAVEFIDPTKTRPRPSLVKQQQVRPTILAERLAGTTSIGSMAVDAKWSNYGAYLRRMTESVQIQWELLIVESKVSVESGSVVTVKFILDSQGKIARILKVDSTTSDTASRACMSAIADRSPYGEWTEDMKAVLGEQQEMTFSFYYQ